MDASLDPLPNPLPGEREFSSEKIARENMKSVPLPSLEFPPLSVYKQVGVGFLMSGV